MESLIFLIAVCLVGVVLAEDDYQEDSTKSVIIIMAFIAVLLLLSGIGIGCGYLCYRRSENQVQLRARVLGEVTRVRNQETSPMSRGQKSFPNWYGPSPEGSEALGNHNNGGIIAGGLRHQLQSHTHQPPQPPR